LPVVRVASDVTTDAARGRVADPNSQRLAHLTGCLTSSKAELEDLRTEAAAGRGGCEPLAMHRFHSLPDDSFAADVEADFTAENSHYPPDQHYLPPRHLSFSTHS
jgi:hypothetical protein